MALVQDAFNSVVDGADASALFRVQTAKPGDVGEDGSAASPRSISLKQVRQFAQLLVQLDRAQLMKRVQVFLDEGIEIDAIYDELLAPAARCLGEGWEQDSCDFVDVTMGLWRLREVMHDFSSLSPDLIAPTATVVKSAIFFPMPGDQHFMGPQILENVFSRAGWDTCLFSEPARGEILSILSKESFDLIGLTLSKDCPSAAASNFIAAMRLASRNPEVSILVGGRMINQNPAIVAEVGADGTGADARAALEVAEALVKSAKVRAQTLV
ncbi:cobalamin B12-binding protein [Erythrobacter sp. SCSIO 43205]|uniref:cobalamin B12-binding domain-containing protein n=1 Tax=Erythrobacter sp. SCSIO 43205 TaxID=2779361 RepID=UPI001CAA15AD|nr:B12-binding domain-containing protein [Erythrobacter sp. SCSIO 43205]UAB78012.1 cobalamin B12-binding protein [Erythrobacter sp. SCSIO 43205]